MDKFNLKWNDFQVNVTKSFSSLRKEKDFFDVTLVSDDEQHISAHKVVLSASSEFFKNILKKATHSSPMIFLSGVSSKDIGHVMDYIYQGEVQLYQEELDTFLDTAQKLKIDGLIGNTDTESGNEDIKVESDSNKEEKLLDERDEVDFVNSLPRATRVNPVKTLSVNNSNIDAKAAVDELVEKIDDGYRCKACGKTTRTLDIRRHAEIHIEGLSFDCPTCSQCFRSRNSLKFHRQTKHTM